MKKITLIALFLTLIFLANAQINFKDGLANMAQAGAVRDTLHTGTVSGTTYYELRHTWNFNTDRTPTLVTEDPAKPGYMGAPQKASTRKGWRGTGVRPGGSATGLVHGNLGKTQSYTGGGDPVYFASISDLKTYLGSTTLKYTEAGKEGPQNDLDSAVTSVIKRSDGDAAWCIYPGKYKKTDTRVYYNLGGSIVTSDLSFDVLTLDPGTSGKTVSVKLIVSVANKAEGSPSVDNTTGFGKAADKTDSATVAYPGSARFEKLIYTSGAPGKTINICKEFGLSIDTLNFKKVIVTLITESSSLIPESGVYDPVIGFDNFKISFWLDVPSLPTITSVDPIAEYSTKIIGKQGEIEIIGGKSLISVFNITGQKIAEVIPSQEITTIALPRGIYILAEQNSKTTKVIVK